MPAWQLNFGIFSLVAVIMLVMASVSFGYLLRIKNRSRASQLLLWLFLCVLLSAIATLVTNLGMAWNWAFAPAQDAFLILGGIFLARFAYAFPAQEESTEARVVMHIFDGLATLAIGYALYFAYTYLSSLPLEIDEMRAYYLLTPISMGGLVLVLFRRSASVSRQAQESARAKPGGRRGLLAELYRPSDVSAIALRNYGLALSIGLIPLIVFLIKPALPAPIASFFFNFGIVISIGAIMLVYLNFAPEPTSITAKLVGISLVTLLLLLGFTCILVLHLYSNPSVHRIVSTFILLVLGSSAFVLLVFPIFFRATLIGPLDRLLEGVRAANEGKLDSRVEARYADEIGFLTRSFNRMIGSIGELTHRLEDRAKELEGEVAAHMRALQDANAQLLQENFRREEARVRLDQQFRYQSALAKCSQDLLSGADENGDRQLILNQGLEFLREGVDASRAYVHRHFIDQDGIRKVAIFAETCAPGVPQQIFNPVNQNFPLADLPDDLVRALESGQPIGGLSQEVFSGHPLAEIFLKQQPPLLSLLLFPIHLEGRWWGFVGFDDCETPREWGETEVLFLRTASELVGSTIHRWEIHNQLVAALGDLERRVAERTRSLNEINAQLQDEITARRKFQDDLESRLKAERLLAKASASLVAAHDLATAFEDMLEDLGQVMEASSFTLVILDPSQPAAPPEIFSWQRPPSDPLNRQLIDLLLEPASWVAPQLVTGQAVWIRGLDQLPPEAQALKEALATEGLDALILWPLVTSGEVMSLLLCCSSALGEQEITDNLQSLEVFISLLAGMLERERILHTLEQRVTEQTRELSTLYEMTMLTSSAYELSEILSPALAKILEISDSEAACIHLYEPEEGHLKLTAHRGLPTQSLAALERIPIQPVFLDWLEKPEPDFTRNQQQPSGNPEQFCLPGFDSFVISKLRAAGTTQGVISCYRVSAETFTPFQTSMLAVIGELLGVVVENHYLNLESKKLATIQERQRLARELHDAVSQSVYSLSLFARSARDAQEAGEEVKLFESLEQLEINSITAVREMRLLLYQLRSLALEEGDLVKAVESRLEMVEHRSGIEVDFSMDNRLELDANVEQELFRVITEALNNTLHYANAKRVTVHLAMEEEQLALIIEDDGIGFDPAQVRSGMGLQNIQDRAAALHGKVEIFSQPGHGTRIQLLLPGSLARIGEGSYG